MTRTSTKRTSLIAGLVAILMTFALLPAAPATASHPAGGATAGLAYLDAGIRSCGSFRFVGVGAAAAADASLAGTSVSASGTYCNPDIVVGEADGTVTFAGGLGTESCNFHWERRMVIALITFSGGSCSGSAVAAFVPLGAPGWYPVTAAVVGGGIF